MPLSPEQQETAKQFITSRGGLQVCPVCAHQNFNLSNNLVITPALGVGDEANTVMSTSAGTPLVELVCMNCGYVRHFHALVLGLFPPS